MPRTPLPVTGKVLSNAASVETLRALIAPLARYTRCESPAFVRRSLEHAIRKDLAPISPHAELVPTAATTALALNKGRSQDVIMPIELGESVANAAIEASAQLKKARLFFEQAQTVGAEIQPILYYYGATYFLDFICRNLVRRQRVGSPGHGLAFSADSEGWDFDRNWARQKSRVEIGTSGDFSYFVDALTIAGFPSFFSKYRLHRSLKTDPWVTSENPAPLFLGTKVSFDLICNFDLEVHLTDKPAVRAWMTGASTDMMWKVTCLLMDVAVLFVASSLARYYTPAWIGVIDADKDDIYNDIRASYRRVSEDLPLFFEDEYPFQYSYGTHAMA